jgi:tRNA(Ile)-lysidine synthase
MRHRPDVYTRWSLEMRWRPFFRPGERVGVAVSGGPDSVLLLDFLQKLASEMGLSLAVVHFNHHLRGAESDADEQLVRQRADALGLEFLRGEAAVAQVARERHRNLEATARDLRYRFFFSLVNQGRLDKVATAHTANDQAETVLLRLMRGTGTHGLGGIYPILDGKIVRPFLTLTREEILLEARKRKLDYRVDSTNLDPTLRRNKVRMELLPKLQKDFNPKVITLLNELAERAREDEAYLEQQARERARPWRVREGSEEKIPVRPLLEFPPAIRGRVLRQMLLATRGSLRGLTRAHLKALLHFAAKAQSGRSLALPGGWAARREFEWLILGPLSPPAASGEFSYLVDVPADVAVPQLGVVLHFKIVGPEAFPKAYNECEIAALDLGKLPRGLILRNWRAGDRYWPLGSRKPRRLKELFLERKIPPGQRALWPVLEAGKQIVWVRGFPLARPMVASPGSTEILLIEEEATPAR